MVQAIFTVTGSLTGPYPVHAWGEGSISVLFFDISVPFDHTFRERRAEPTLPPTDPWPFLAAAIVLATNWSSELTPGTTVGVSLRQPQGAAGLMLLHPMGLATLRERVVPLNRTLERFGQYQISGPNHFGITDVLVADSPPGRGRGRPSPTTSHRATSRTCLLPTSSRATRSKTWMPECAWALRQSTHRPPR